MLHQYLYLGIDLNFSLYDAQKIKLEESFRTRDGSDIFHSLPVTKPPNKTKVPPKEAPLVKVLRLNVEMAKLLRNTPSITCLNDNCSGIITPASLSSHNKWHIDQVKEKKAVNRGPKRFRSQGPGAYKVSNISIFFLAPIFKSCLCSSNCQDLSLFTIWYFP